eukprot:jgi/Hompol1/2452/HPOL_005580-RA
MSNLGRRASFLSMNDNLLPGPHFNTDDNGQVSAFEIAIKDLIGIAEDILDMDVALLMAPGTCRTTINQIVELQQRWRANADWPLAEVVLRLLMVFASVARLLEHLEEDTRMWMYATGNGGQVSQVKFVTSSSVSRRQTPNRPGIFASPRIVVRRDSVSSNISSGTGIESSDAEIDEDNATDSEVGSRESTPRRIRPAPRKSRLRRQRPFLQIVGKHGKQDKWSLGELKAAVDEGQNLNVLLEIGNDGILTYISPSSYNVFGYDPASYVGTSSFPFLPSPDHNVLLQAYQACPDIDRHIVEIEFDIVRQDSRPLKLEAKGMLSLDKATGKKRSMVWVARPTGLKGELWENALYGLETADSSREPTATTSNENTSPQDAGDSRLATSVEASADTSKQPLLYSASRSEQALTPTSATSAPPGAPSSTIMDMMDTASMVLDEPIPVIDLALCNICERSVPAIFFEEHNELCISVHKNEMDIVLANDQLKDFRTQILDKITLLDEEISDERKEQAEMLAQQDDAVNGRANTHTNTEELKTVGGSREQHASYL